MPIYFERCLGKHKVGSRQQDSRTLVRTHSPAAGCCRPVRGSSWSLGVAGRRLSSASGTGPVEECECWQVPRLVPKLCRVLLCRAFPRTGRLVARVRISTASMRPLAATGERRARRMTAPASAGCTKMERGQEKKWASGEARGLRGAAGPRQQGFKYVLRTWPRTMRFAFARKPWTGLQRRACGRTAITPAAPEHRYKHAQQKRRVCEVRTPYHAAHAQTLRPQERAQTSVECALGGFSLSSSLCLLSPAPSTSLGGQSSPLGRPLHADTRGGGHGTQTVVSWSDFG